MSATDKVHLSATLVCKDAATAQAASKIASASRDKLGTQLKHEPEQELRTLERILDSIQLSEKDAQVSAQVTVDAASVAEVLSLLMPQEAKRLDKR
jgi:hypothetical protein